VTGKPDHCLIRKRHGRSTVCYGGGAAMLIVVARFWQLPEYWRCAMSA